MSKSLKLVIIGDGGTGKSSITVSFLGRGEFSEEYDPTIEDSYSVTRTVDGEEYSVEIIDTSGQEEYRGLWGEGTIRDADGFIVVYAIDSKTSFDQVSSFLHTVRKVKSPDEGPSTENSIENTPFPFVLLGNKTDLQERRVVSDQDGLAFSRAAGGLFFSCSAKTGANIIPAFESLIRATVKAKNAKEIWLKSHNNADFFNGNSAYLDSQAGVGFEEEKMPPRVRNPNLSMDRNKSRSVGGLGDRDDSEGGCCCVVS